MFCVFRYLVVHSTDTDHEYGIHEHDLQLKLPPKREQKRTLETKRPVWCWLLRAEGFKYLSRKEDRRSRRGWGVERLP